MEFAKVASYPHICSLFMLITLVLVSLSLSHGCHINDIVINHLFYADDLCLMAPSPAALQVLINICSQFSDDNDLTFNPNKSMCMVMKPRKYKLSCPSVYIDTTEISYIDTAKYIGVIISHDLSDDTDMKRQLYTP